MSLHSDVLQTSRSFFGIHFVSSSFENYLFVLPLNNHLTYYTCDYSSLSERIDVSIQYFDDRNDTFCHCAETLSACICFRNNGFETLPNGFCFSLTIILCSCMFKFDMLEFDVTYMIFYRLRCCVYFFLLCFLLSLIHFQVSPLNFLIQ